MGVGFSPGADFPFLFIIFVAIRTTHGTLTERIKAVQPEIYLLRPLRKFSVDSFETLKPHAKGEILKETCP